MHRNGNITVNYRTKQNTLTLALYVMKSANIALVLLDIQSEGERNKLLTIILTARGGLFIGSVTLKPPPPYVARFPAYDVSRKASADK